MGPPRIVNLSDVQLSTLGDQKLFAAQVGKVGALLGSSGLGCAVVVVPPGKAAFPLHRHHVIDELFYVIDGQGTLRLGEASHPVRTADIVAAPAGTQAHQIANTSNRELG